MSMMSTTPRIARDLLEDLTRYISCYCKKDVGLTITEVTGANTAANVQRMAFTRTRRRSAFLTAVCKQKVHSGVL